MVDCVLLVKRLAGYENLSLPVYQSEFAAGMDLYANLPVECRSSGVLIPVMGRVLITTGISIEIPQNCEGQIRSRSGLVLNDGVSVLNSPGTIDADYRGHLKVILVNFGDKDFLVKQGNRIAQLVISPVLRPKILEVNSLSSSDRGSKGFGSTGVA